MSIDDAYDRARISIENLRSVWAIEDYANYLKLSQLLNNMDFSANLSSIAGSISGLNGSIDSVVRLHNNLLAELNRLSLELHELAGFVNILEDKDISDKMLIHAKNFTNVAFLIIENRFGNYSDAIESVKRTAIEQTLIAEKSRIPAASIFFDRGYRLRFESDLLCSLSQTCDENISIINPAIKTEEFLTQYPNLSYLNQSCSRLKELNQTYFNLRNKSLERIKNESITFPSDSKFFESANEFMDNEIRKINNSYIESFEKILLENKTSSEAISIINSTLPKSKAETIEIVYNESVNISLYLLSKIEISGESSKLLSKCSNLEKPMLAIENLSFEPVSADIPYKIVSRIDTNVPDTPICCVFSDCRPCCRNESCKNDPKTFPVIFLHGHSVAKSNSPEFSLDAFNKLQYKLQEDGYLNAGNLLYSENESIGEGDLGISGKPVTFKVTYYYDVYRKEGKYDIVPTKSENIDTYVIRLNNIVNVVKEKTGKPKVNIIAFSMGGLVARRYMQVFGSDSVDKIITIGTPHKGIVGIVSGLCPVAGENKECADMQQDSLFLNKLNDPSKQPLQAKISNIIGIGCLRNGQDGDGIVLSDHASLNGIVNATEFFVDGSCHGALGHFHTDLLDIDKYPEVYKIVKEALTS